ncbi:Uu.00g124950.m01.CDS01 [Anthostomella pinea]|uniref:Uu.00g124950.m01.CDS01 n=1 Tax=Anthostomella pinea TaxID=933095 RepID=A0AAI8YHN5_9PEZI|nr:Uu.00g124950.m01.CDS01 [Anthostomella pinea]
MASSIQDLQTSIAIQEHQIDMCEKMINEAQTDEERERWEERKREHEEQIRDKEERLEREIAENDERLDELARGRGTTP